MMAFLIGLALFSAALLHPYGRALLATMLGVVLTIGLLGWIVIALNGGFHETAPTAPASYAAVQ